MTESILKSIMRLFAIIGNLRQDNDSSTEDVSYYHTREITEAFLMQMVNPEQTSKYLQMFDFHIKNLQRRKISTTKKRVALFSVKTLLICEQINSRLDIKQKSLVLLQLIDILKLEGSEPLAEAYEFLQTISESFGFENFDFHLMQSFVNSSVDEKAQHPSFLFITGQKEPDKFLHHLYRENILGSITVFYLPSNQSYFIRHENYDDEIYLNGRNVMFKRIYLFEKGSAIRCPKISTIHYSDVIGLFQHMKSAAEIQLTALGVEYNFRNSDNGLKQFSLNARSGQLIGIMGGSGVGKSTLLSILNGTLKPDSGRVLINGIDIYENKDKVNGIIGYIPQDDFLVEELSVYENLFFNAKFCFSGLEENQQHNKIDKLLQDLDLFEIKDLKVGSPLNKLISGGQRKRLNIALELLREPYVLFVDEPTSGLSSADSEKVMDLLKKQTYKSKLVVVNIHQPSSDIFKMFDKLLVLDKGGRVIYFGNPIDSLVYFKTATQLINSNESECIWCGNLNPEQILQIIESKEVNSVGKQTGRRFIEADEWYQLYLNNIDSRLHIIPESKSIPATGFKLPSKVKQFFLYLFRNIKCKLADNQYLIVNIFEAPVLAFILSFLTRYTITSSDGSEVYSFNENINLPAYLFMSIVVALFLGLMGSAEEIIKDAKLLKRESFLNLSRQSYIHSKIFFLFAISAFQMLCYVLIGNYILEIEGMNLIYWIILFSLSCFANMLGLILSAGMRSVIAIYILIPLLLIPQLLLSGVIVKFDKLNSLLKSDIYVPIIGDLMASRWAYEALAVEQFKSNSYESKLYDVEKEESAYTYSTNYLIPDLLNRIGACELYMDQSNKRNYLIKELPLVKEELKKLSSFLKISSFNDIDKLDINYFNESVFQDASSYLRRARTISAKLLNRAIENKDNLMQQLEERTGGHSVLLALKQKYHNQSLADQVQNKSESDKIIEKNGKLFRKYEPIYYIPESNYGRAHFYAPFKRIGIYITDTFIFNILVIWLMTLVLYFILRANLLSRIIKYIEFRKS